jgi:hypothetical protein
MALEDRAPSGLVEMAEHLGAESDVILIGPAEHTDVVAMDAKTEIALSSSRPSSAPHGEAVK